MYLQANQKTITNRKNVHVTATTGMAGLQFVNAKTIHSWSGYGDGHKDINHLVNKSSLIHPMQTSRTEY